MMKCSVRIVGTPNKVRERRDAMLNKLKEEWIKLIKDKGKYMAKQKLKNKLNGKNPRKSVENMIMVSLNEDLKHHKYMLTQIIKATIKKRIKTRRNLRNEL